LRRSGWTVVTIWECEIECDETALPRLLKLLVRTARGYPY
jgi:G:T-mismatch repair DNA endonuclease (very short patch repair protein)